MPERLTFLLPRLGRSGGTRTLIEWANRSAEEGLEVNVWALYGGPGHRLINPRVKVDTASPWLQRSLSAWRRIAPDGLVENTELRLAPRIADISVPLDDVDIAVAGFPPWFSPVSGGRAVSYAQHWEPIWFDSKIGRRIAERRILGARSLISNSSWLATKLRESHVLADLVFPGVDLATFKMRTGSRPARSQFRIVALGRRVPEWKGLADLTAALEMSISKPVELILFGGDRRAQETTSWGSTQEVGPLSPQDLSSLYKDADCVVTPSWFESFPLPPLEAMASGTPVITTRFGTEDYAIDGVNSLVVPPRQPAAMARAIERLIQDGALAARLSGSGLLTAQRFTWAAGYEQFRSARERHVGLLA